MNKKIIAVLLVATTLFMCVFAACNKADEDEEVIYVKNKDINYVTDENGEKLLDFDGRIIVYATDEDGKKIKDDNGEYVTQAQEFQPIEDDGVVEDLGFFFEIPDGWKTTKQFGVFTNEKKAHTLEITIVEQTYDDYYAKSYEDYEDLLALSEANKGNKDVKQFSTTWKEDIDLGEDFGDICRFTLETEESMIIMYFFNNSKNLYKVRYIAEQNRETAVADSEAMLKAMTFKPYAYYNDITAKPTTTAATTEIVSTTVSENA